MSNRLDDRIQRIVRLIGEASPEPPPFPSDRIGAKRGIGVSGRVATTSRPFARTPLARGIVVAAGAFLVVLIAVAVSVGLLGGPSDVAGTTIAVLHEVIEYNQTADLICSGGQAVSSGGFDSMTIEVWADQEQQRFRQQVTYPDGTTRDLIALDDPWYPTQSFARGKLRGGQGDCVYGPGPDDVDVMMAEPAQGPGIYAPNPVAEVPMFANGSPMVDGYANLGVLVPGEHTDSLGRPASLYRSENHGFMERGGGSQPLVQVTEWFVDPDTRRVLEQTFRWVTDRIATVTTMATVVVYETTDVDPTLFDTDGYDLIWEADPAVKSEMSGPVTTVTGQQMPLSQDGLSQQAVSVLASIDGVAEVLRSVSRPEERQWGNLVVTTEDRNTIEVWWQRYSPADEGTDGLSEPGDDIQQWEDGTVAYVRDRSPEYVQVVFVRDHMLGSVILEAGTPLPDDFVGPARPAETITLQEPTVDTAIGLARDTLDALMATGFDAPAS